jgi:hypothetical protein
MPIEWCANGTGPSSPLGRVTKNVPDPCLRQRDSRAPLSSNSHHLGRLAAPTQDCRGARFRPRRGRSPWQDRYADAVARPVRGPPGTRPVHLVEEDEGSDHLPCVCRQSATYLEPTYIMRAEKDDRIDGRRSRNFILWPHPPGSHGVPACGRGVQFAPSQLAPDLHPAGLVHAVHLKEGLGGVQADHGNAHRGRLPEPVHGNRCWYPGFLSTDRDGHPLSTLPRRPADGHRADLDIDGQVCGLRSCADHSLVPHVPLCVPGGRSVTSDRHASSWRRWIDTSSDSPLDIRPPDEAPVLSDCSYRVAPRSVVCCSKRSACRELADNHLVPTAAVPRRFRLSNSNEVIHRWSSTPGR